MKVSFDAEADILYIQFRDGNVKDMEDIDEDVWMERDEKGEIIGLEIHRAEKWIKEFHKTIGKECSFTGVADIKQKNR